MVLWPRAGSLVTVLVPFLNREPHFDSSPFRVWELFRRERLPLIVVAIPAAAPRRGGLLMLETNVIGGSHAM